MSKSKTKPLSWLFFSLTYPENFMPLAGSVLLLPRKRYKFTLIELLVVIAIIAIVVTSKAGFFLQFSAIFAFKAL